jgi:hypothetical protein
VPRLNTPTAKSPIFHVPSQHTKGQLYIPFTYTFSSGNQIINFIGVFLKSKDSILLDCSVRGLVVPNVSKEQTAFIVKDQGVLQTFYDCIFEDMDGMFLQNIRDQ